MSKATLALPRGQSDNQTAGFTLVEVAVAVAILGLALVTLVGLQTRALDQLIYERSLIRASLYAEYLMARIESQRKLPDLGTESGDLKSKLNSLDYFSDDNSPTNESEDLEGWEFEVEVSDIPVPPFEEALRRVDVRVTWAEGDRYSIQITNFLKGKPVYQLIGEALVGGLQ